MVVADPLAPEEVPLPRPHRATTLARSPWAVAGVVLALYGLCLAALWLGGHDPRDFIYIGRTYVQRSHASAVITIDPSYHYTANPVGYDGQFVYYIALDPGNARYYSDVPAYRYERILYPMLTRLLAWGQPTAIPVMLLLINWLAAAGGTLGIAAWLQRRGCSPYFALCYGLALGLFTAFLRDLTEPLAYALVALAIYLYDFGGRRRVWYSAITFALAGLARETTLIFVVPYALALVLREGVPRSRRAWWARLRARGWRALGFCACATLPLAGYKLFLRVWLGGPVVNSGVMPTLVPLAGLIADWPWRGDQILQVVTVVVPALVCGVLAIRAVLLHIWEVEVWALLANIVLLVLLLPPDEYADIFASPRVSLAVVLSALLCLPYVVQTAVARWRWMAICGSLWAGTFPLLAVAVVRSLV